MEAINLWLPLIGVGIFGAIAVSAWFADKKILGVWFGFACGVCLLLLIALQVGQSIREANKNEVLSPEAAALRILVSAQAKSQRAWLSVRPQLTREIKLGEPINIELIVENVGKEPAIGTSHHGVSMMFDMPEQIGYAPDLWSAQFAQVIRLESDLAGPIPGRATIFPANKLTIEARWDHLDHIEPLMSGKKILVIYGAAGYFTLNEPHHTWYCFYLMHEKGGQWRLGSAPIGNDAN
jgi:hypothetical protein